MGLFDRLSLFLRAEAGGIVDDLSDRARIIRQQLHDAEDALADERDRLARREARLADLRAEEQRLDQRIATLDADIALCLAQEKDDLARFSIRKLLPLKQQRQRCQQESAALTGQIASDRQTIIDHEATLGDLHARCSEQLAQAGKPSGDPAQAVHDEEVELELLRRQQEVQHA